MTRLMQLSGAVAVLAGASLAAELFGARRLAVVLLVADVLFLAIACQVLANHMDRRS